jgi:hypothetical protein
MAGRNTDGTNLLKIWALRVIVWVIFIFSLPLFGKEG